MNQRSERLAAEIQTVLGELIARGEIRDPRVREAGIVTITWVRVTGDLSEARVGFTVFGADAKALERTRQGLQAARSYLQQILARKLRARKTATLSFETDRTLDNAFRVDGLLRADAADRVAAAAAAAPGEAGGPGDGDVAGESDAHSGGEGDGDNEDEGAGSGSSSVDGAGADGGGPSARRR